MANGGGRSLIGKILFIVGVVIILIVLAFLIIRFVPKIFSGLANVGSSLSGAFNRNEIVLTTTASSVQDGDRFVANWEYEPTNPGSYSITYDCIDDVLLDIETDSGTRRLLCTNAFTLGPDAKSANLRIHLDKEDSYADVPIIVRFTENGENTAKESGETTVTVQNGVPETNAGDLSNAVIESEDVTESNSNDDDSDVQENNGNSSSNTNNSGNSGGDDNVIYVESGSRSVVTTGGTSVVAVSPADLAVSNVVAFGNQVAFTVSNVGGRSSGNWLFNYSTPTSPSQTATSPLQISLAPGQAIRYTLTFSQKDSGNQNVVIAVDPFNSVFESNESNNIATVTFTGGSFGGGNNNGGSNNGGSGNFDEDDDADFVIEDLEVGRLSGSRFIDDDNADEGDDVAIRFTVRNRGGERTDDWRFEIKDTPYDKSNNTFRSREYDDLRPGEEIEIVVEFENVDEGNYDIEVEVDSEDDTDEERENNNDDSVELDVDR